MSDDSLADEIGEIERDTEMWKPSTALSPDRFQFLWMVAERLACSSVVPASLRETGRKNNKVDLPFDQVVANVFLVVEQADRWNISPVALLACAHIVHGKLGFEGKVIAAVLQARFGIDLSYEWSGDGDDMKIVVSGKKPGSDKPLTIEGTVRNWKTTGDGTPWQPKNYPKMLAYRGAREWARLHKPAAIIGILSEDELYEIEYEARARAARDVSSLGSALAGERSDNGFHPDNLKQLENNSAAPMEVVETGEKIPVGDRQRAVQRQAKTEAGPAQRSTAAETEKATTEAKSTNTETASTSSQDAEAAAGDKPAEREGSEGKSGDPSPAPACPPETMEAYHKALLRGLQPKTLIKLKEEFWKDRSKRFDEASTEKLREIYTEHNRRCAREIDGTECEKRVAAVIAREAAA